MQRQKEETTMRYVKDWGTLVVVFLAVLGGVYKFSRLETAVKLMGPRLNKELQTKVDASVAPYKQLSAKLDLIEFGKIPLGSVLPYHGYELQTDHGTVDHALTNKGVVYVGGNKDWVVCNGCTIQGRTVPDLTGRFLLGSLKLGLPGGSKTLTVKVRVTEAHDDHKSNIGNVSVGANGCSLTGTGNAEGLPPYFPVIYIMRVN
jgi:hypothetical protein